MSLNNYLIKKNLDEPKLQAIIRLADKGHNLPDIVANLPFPLTERETYAILCRYCQENNEGHVSIQYPDVYEYFEEMKEAYREDVERGRIINQNKKALASTFEDLMLLSEEQIKQT